MEVLVHSTTAFKLEDMHESQVPHGQFETYTASKTRDVEPASLHHVRSSGVRVRRSPRLEWKLAEQTNTEVSVHADQHTWPRARSRPNPAHGNHGAPSKRREQGLGGRDTCLVEVAAVPCVRVQCARSRAGRPCKKIERAGGRAGSTWTTNRPTLPGPRLAHGRRHRHAGAPVPRG